MKALILSLLSCLLLLSNAWGDGIIGKINRLEYNQQYMFCSMYWRQAATEVLMIAYQEEGEEREAFMDLYREYDEASEECLLEAVIYVEVP